MTVARKPRTYRRADGATPALGRKGCAADTGGEFAFRPDGKGTSVNATRQTTLTLWWTRRGSWPSRSRESDYDPSRSPGKTRRLSANIAVRFFQRAGSVSETANFGRRSRFQLVTFRASRQSWPRTSAKK